jgi:hypothetical protein
MSKFITAVAAAALVVGAAAPATAQDANDAVAFFALISTPYGALPAVASGPANAGPSLDVRYGRYSFEGSDYSINNIGLGGNFAAAGGRMGIMLGMVTGEEGDGAKMAGVDYNRSVWSNPVGASTTSTISLALHPAIGYGKFDDVDLNSMSAALDLPVQFSMSTGNGMQFVSHLAPGFGWGRLSDETDSESGTRAVLGGGVGLLNIGGGLGVNIGFRKIFLDEAPTQWGLGMSWSR